MALSILAINDVAQALLGCVCEALDRLPDEVPGLAGCPCRNGVVAGLPAADACESDCGPLGPGEWPGQLTVHTNRIYASDALNFPRELGALSTNVPGSGIRDLRNCLLPQVTAVELVVTVFRCATLPDGQCPPDMAALALDAIQLHADLLAVQQGILCCFAGTRPDQIRGQRYVMGDTNVTGPEGGCVGFTTTVVAALDDCLPCPEPEPLDAAPKEL